MPDSRETEIEKVARELILMARNTLIVNLRFMDASISKLRPVELEKLSLISTDGKNIGYNPAAIIKIYKNEKTSVNRALLHSILHCVFQHFFVDLSIKRMYWDLAADIAIENIINDLDLMALDANRSEKQKREIEELHKKVKYLTAECIYRYFVDNSIGEKEIIKLSKLFTCDEHDVWYERNVDLIGTVSSNDGMNKDSNHNGLNSTEYKLLRDGWKEISEHMQMDLKAFCKNRGDVPGSLTQNLREVNREKYDYSLFLKKFATMGEVMKVNDDEFDYIFYTYGLQKYKKMPLIEPLEYKETKRIKEFIIAIDTSASTSGELVQTFVQKTYNILKQEESFFTKINLHIIQCDADIQEDCKITCQEEFDSYLRNFRIKGGGGTDFRPVFEYVNQLIKIKEFTNLKGMIYFTDGFGIFPEQQPEYNTAVIYVDDGCNNPNVPVWVIKLVLKPEDI